ncbi:sigma-70 family RNA polymerase sigma factor [Paraclostridium ghonii]|uniref:RNA polymerase sigma-70 factor (ECF subfamily) n=1 Tax=Paraclostridium ghonii TaxID=29358 RepID=A0ABU0N4D1_9FIRM|nr:sigma-70 family RNA polymerase sigma factor [Paeniclostridium ghonii]MDQ0558025.1 RNA polymerase sigma-70 factor (ECF subfamily) [Paeniclostridium ghonii]
MLELEDIENLVDEYGTIVYKFCIKISQNKEEGEDLYQQTFLKALELRKKLCKDKNSKGFLISIAVKLRSNNVRKFIRRNTIAPNINANEYESLIIKDTKSNIENEVIHKEVKKEVNLAVSKLQDKFKLPIIMYYTGDMSVEEISRALKIPKGTVKSRMHKARSLIKSELEEIGYERI